VVMLVTTVTCFWLHCNMVTEPKLQKCSARLTFVSCYERNVLFAVRYGRRLKKQLSTERIEQRITARQQRYYV
jgi:hypothetical protein